MRQIPELPPTPALTQPLAEALLGAVEELADLRELDAVVTWVRRTARRLVGADGICVILREGDAVRYVDEDAVAPLWKGQCFPLAACVSGAAIQARAPIAIADVLSDPRVPHALYQDTFVRSMAMVPIGAHEPTGAVGAYWAVRRQPAHEEVAVLQALAGAASPALDNARLYAAEREARRAAEREARLRQELLAAVSHDLGNPLSVISMCAAQLVPLVVPCGERAEQSLDLLRRTALHMEALLRDLLELGAIDAGELRLTPRPTDVGALVAAVGDLAPLASERGQRLELEPPATPAQVRCDPARVHRVFTNLVGNAVKFTPRGGTIRVRAQPREGFFDFEVSDSGPGIASEALPRLFQRFQRASPDQGGGMGLGLYIARGIVEAHGGAIRAEGAEGGGARIVFSLPREG